MRTRMSGGVGAGRAILPATRFLGHGFMVYSQLARLRQVGFAFRAKFAKDFRNFFAMPEFMLKKCVCLLLPSGSFLIGRGRRYQRLLQVFLEHYCVAFVEIQSRSACVNAVNIRAGLQKQFDCQRSLPNQSALQRGSPEFIQPIGVCSGFQKFFEQRRGDFFWQFFIGCQRKNRGHICVADAIWISSSFQQKQNQISDGFRRNIVSDCVNSGEQGRTRLLASDF